MQDLRKPLIVVLLVLAVPILPFVLAGEWIEGIFAQAVRQAASPGILFTGVVAILAVDVFLPVPSSGIGTFAGAKLGILPGTLAVWLGLTAGAAAGFAVARAWGYSVAERFAGRRDLERLESAARRFGGGLLLLSRPLPIVAEAAVLLLGTMRLPWRRFWWPVVLANLAISVSYAALGGIAEQRGWLLPAVAVSLVLPLAIAWLVRQTSLFGR